MQIRLRLSDDLVLPDGLCHWAIERSGAAITGKTITPEDEAGELCDGDPDAEYDQPDEWRDHTDE